MNTKSKLIRMIVILYLTEDSDLYSAPFLCCNLVDLVCEKDVGILK